jgi:isocitrate lyase
MYPDQSLYPANAGPGTGQAHQPHAAARRPDRDAEGGAFQRDWFMPIVADAEAGFGGPLNCFEIMKALSRRAPRASTYEDQLASEKKCGHLGGKVLIPTAGAYPQPRCRASCRRRHGHADTGHRPHRCGSAKLITSDIDERDQPFVDRCEPHHRGLLPGEGRQRLEPCIARASPMRPLRPDLVETSQAGSGRGPPLRRGVHKVHPGKLLAYNCSPSFNWKKNLDDATIAKFQRELGAMGYKFQFITLAGFHQLNYGMFELARGYKDRRWRPIPSCSRRVRRRGQRLHRHPHQREVGTGYFDQPSMTGICMSIRIRS